LGVKEEIGRSCFTSSLRSFEAASGWLSNSKVARPLSSSTLLIPAMELSSSRSRATG